eukprot:7391898-Prymnesium_polylepis.1
MGAVTTEDGDVPDAADVAAYKHGRASDARAEGEAEPVKDPVKMGVKELKAALKALGKTQTGDKAELVRKLTEARAEPQPDPAAATGTAQGAAQEGSAEAEAEAAAADAAAEECSREHAPAGDLLQDEDEDGDEEALPELDEDAETGGMLTAIAVWHMSVLHQEAVHERIADPDNLEQRRAYGTKGQATGQKWFLALMAHTDNKATWQYPHDSAAHFLEDALEHGQCDTVDDSILEKGNRRKKRLGDRCVFRGGTNEEGTTFTYKRQVKERDEKGVWTGEFKTIEVTRRANLGPAAQAQRLDFAAAWFEGRRKPVVKKSRAVEQTEIAKKEIEAAKREVVKDELGQLARKKAKPDTCEEAMSE